jgi:hypothetical protein
MGYVYIAIATFICFILFAIGLGLYLAFSASVLLGIVVLIVEPAPLVIGLWYIFFGVNLAEKWLAMFT